MSLSPLLVFNLDSHQLHQTQKSPPSTLFLLHWSSRRITTEMMMKQTHWFPIIKRQNTAQDGQQSVILSMYLVNLLSLLHLLSRSNTTGTPKQTSVYLVEQPAPPGHCSDENNLDTHWVCESKHSTWIIQWLEGPNEAFIECLGNVMNHACSGQGMTESIYILLDGMTLNTSHSTRLIGQAKWFTGLFLYHVLWFTCDCG